MKLVFAIAALLLTILTVVAVVTIPSQGPSGRRTITWITDENPVRKEQMDAFMAAHPDYHLRLDPGGGSLDKVIVQSIAGVGPTVFDCYDGNQLASYVRSGVALDLTDELKKRGIDLERDAFPGTASLTIYRDRAYAMPSNVAVDGIWFHKDVFVEEGVPFPKGPMRWPEFIEIAKRMTKRDAAGRPIRFGVLLPWANWRHVFATFGATVYSEDGTECVVDSPGAVAAVQLLYDLVYLHKVAPSPIEQATLATQGGWGSGEITLFSARRSAMALGGRWWLAQLRKETGLRLGVCESPYGTVRRFRGYGRSTAVNAMHPDREGALKFLMYLASPEYGRLVNNQADGVSAFRRDTLGDEFLHNPAHPEEDMNEIWRTMAEFAVPDDVSPFIDGSVATRLLQKQFDLVQNGLKNPQAAMRDAARAVNGEIKRMIAEDPELRAEYDRRRAARKP